MVIEYWFKNYILCFFHFRSRKAQLTLANLSIDKRSDATTSTSKPEATPSVDMAREPRKLTPRRKQIIEEFMGIFETNVTNCVSYGSRQWINALVEHLHDRYILPVDIEHWLNTTRFFKKVSNISP